MDEALEPTQDPGWLLSHEGYNVLTESAVESSLAFGGPVGCAPGGLLRGGGLAWAARGALARPSRTKARAMVRDIVRIECSIGNRGSAVPVKVQVIRQGSH